MARSTDSLEGKQLGGYELGKLLGSGGMGAVYRATPKTGGRAVAIKVLAPELARDPKAIERFEREAEAVRRLEHPNVVRIHEVGSARGQHFLVMELVSGPPFRRLIDDADAPKRVIAVLAQVADGLAHAHARGIVHRDIKPDNVLISRSDRAAIADFGLARVSDAASLTGRALLGTAKYMSPEQAQGEKAGAPSDVYSLGVMIYEAITGDAPFASETQHGYIFKHVSEAPPRPEVRPGFPASLGRLALECLAKDPAARPTMDDVAARVHAALETRARSSRLGWIAVPLVAIASWLALPSALEIARALVGVR
ncbi:MAG TPA: serine/threonine-protein kinase [Kofleriaceae bacterium]|nr:serine/threonine-protein kinase [Kofleriaceae bacterium]